jgi:hypothetical protein
MFIHHAADGHRVYYRSRKEAYLKTELPYGIWTCENGREVLFNRNYQPIVQRHNGRWSRADAKEWVYWKEQWYFYGDPKWFKQPFSKRIHRLESILADFRFGYDVQKRSGIYRDGKWLTRPEVRSCSARSIVPPQPQVAEPERVM